MASNVLSQQYVDIIARGLQETLAALRGIQGQAEQSGGAMRKFKAGVQDAGSGGVGGGGGFGGLFAGLGKVRAALAAILASVAGVVALIKQGFSGTVEAEQLGQAFTMIGRELDNFFAPAVQFVADILKQMVGIFQSTGAAGQTMAGRLIGPWGYVLEVFSNPRIQSALGQLLSAFGQLVQAMQPLLNLVANIGTALLDAFVIEPLLAFIKGLTFVLMVVKEIATRIIQVAQGFGLIAAMSRDPAQSRRELRLNQTGTEDANGTFQRIQQAILKSVSPERNLDAENAENLGKIQASAALLVDQGIAALKEIAGIATTLGQLVSKPGEAAAGAQVAGNVLMNGLIAGLVGMRR